MKLLNKINFLITPKQRKKLIILSLFIFIGMILEIVGLSILIPILSILLEPETYQNNFLIDLEKFNFSKTKKIVITYTPFSLGASYLSKQSNHLNLTQKVFSLKNRFSFFTGKALHSK